MKTYVDRSTLVPDHIVSRLLLPRLEQLRGQSLLLDGKKNSAFNFILYFIDTPWYIDFEFFVSQQLQNVFLLVQCHVQWWEPLLPATPQICFIATDMTQKIFRLINMLELGPPPDKHSHLCMFRNMVPNFSGNVS